MTCSAIRTDQDSPLSLGILPMPQLECASRRNFEIIEVGVDEE